jgi:hypothetical protein
VLKNFVVADSVGIKVGVRYADLHNDYDFSQVRLSAREAMVEIEFKLSPDSSASSLPESIVLQFRNVDWFQTSHGVAGRANSELVEIGYKEPGDADHDWLIREEQAAPGSHLFFRLPGDEFIRIHARSASALFMPQ